MPMIGPSVTGAEIRSTTSQIARQIYAAMENAQRFHAFLLATPDGDLEAEPFNLPADVVLYMKSAMSDAAQLAAIFEGTATQATAVDFRRFLGMALGTGLF